jgi:hypothetical protein
VQMEIRRERRTRQYPLGRLWRKRQGNDQGYTAYTISSKEVITRPRRRGPVGTVRCQPYASYCGGAAAIEEYRVSASRHSNMTWNAEEADNRLRKL